MYDLRNKLDGKEARRQHREEQYISIMFGDLYLPRIEQHRCYVSASLPLLLMSPRHGSCGRDGGGYLHVCDSALPSPLWPPSRADPAQPVCVSWRNCLLSCADQINRPCLWGAGGWRSGVCVLFSSLGVDKELFDGVERNESDLGQLIWFTQRWSGHCREQ